MPNKIEKRKHPRSEVKWPITVLTDHGTIEGETRNVSVDGLAISCEEPLRINEIYRMSISPPNHPAIGVTGKVIWSALYGIEDDSTTVGIGVCYVEISEEDRSLFRDVVYGYPQQ